jgi:peptidoglycan/xylan/chitin deacetylase (PgdA/CDA1 family)
MRAALGEMRRTIISSAFERRIPLGSSGPIVSFTFDDFPRSALTVGGELLKSFGARGTYYTSIGLMNSETELGEQFRREDLELLLHEGHELGHHTFGHISCRSVPARDFREEVRKGRTAIEKLTGYWTPSNFAYPFGEVTLGAKRLVGAEVASSRGIWPGFNGPVVDLSLLRANRLYGDRASCAKVQKLILENERRRSWIIFYTHDVRSAPSRYGCTADLLEFAVSFALQRKSRVLKIADVIAELVSQPRDKEDS